MGITYNKEFKSKDRLIMPSGPRDRQLRQKQAATGVVQSVDQSLLIEELRSQILKLQEKIDKPIKSSVSDDQLNSIIAEAIKEETKTLKEKHNAEIIELKGKISTIVSEYDVAKKSYLEEISSLKTAMVNKDKLIDELKVNSNNNVDNKLTALLTEATKKIDELSLKMVNGPVEVSPTSDRPKMENVFVDPIEKESKVESHIEAVDVSSEHKVQINDKVNKLKNLLGKLPSRG